MHECTGKDIIGLAQTGSGKTGAFALPIIQLLLNTNPPPPFFGCVLSPTRSVSLYFFGEIVIDHAIYTRSAVNKPTELGTLLIGLLASV